MNYISFHHALNEMIICLQTSPLCLYELFLCVYVYNDASVFCDRSMDIDISLTFYVKHFDAFGDHI